jgi:lysophospholipid acyltransferase (LPLAT)-like uncharacterized protein
VSVPATTPEIAESAPSDERRFTLRERLLLWLIANAAYIVIRLLGATWRYEGSGEETGWERFPKDGGIFVFWHHCVLPAAHRFRNQNIAIMTSRSFDGEAIARLIEKMGYQAVRGSSSRGGARALLEMHKIAEQGRPVVFTADGPRGPRFVAKPGAVLLARNSGLPVRPFDFAAERAWVLNSWDKMVIPRPFTRVVMRVGGPVRVGENATQDEMTRRLEEMQAGLDRVREAAEKAATDRA